MKPKPEVWCSAIRSPRLRSANRLVKRHTAPHRLLAIARLAGGTRR